MFRTILAGTVYVDLDYEEVGDVLDADIRFSTSYYVVNGVTFVPSLRWASPPKNDDEQPVCNIENAELDGDEPCDMCREVCEELHPKTASGVMKEVVTEALIDGPLAVVGGTLNALGIDSSMFYNIFIYCCCVGFHIHNEVL